MAHQFATGIATDSGDLLVKLRDFVVTTTGWTSLQDTVTTGATSQYFSVRSLGESGNERTVLRFFRTTANTISVLGYLNWASGVGTQQIGSTSGTAGTGTFILTDDDDFVKYWFFGSLDRVVVITRTTVRAASSTVYAGLYTRARSSTVVTCTNTPAAGTNVVINVASTAWATVGNYYTIVDDNNFEWFKVTALSTNVSVTAEKLFSSYASGSRLGEDPRPCVVLAETQNLGLYNANHYMQAPAWRRVPMTQGFVRTVPLAEGGYERLMLDAGVNNKALLWPIGVYDEAILSSGYCGQLVESFVVAQEGVATDDTITVGGSTYRVFITAAPYTPSTSPAVAPWTVATRVVLAIRQS